MPKRRTDDVVHVTMTDHLIQRRPPAGDLLADKTEIHDDSHVYRVSRCPKCADPLYAALAQVRDGSNLQAGLPRLASLVEQNHPPEAGFYTALANGYRSAGEVAKALPWYEEAVKHAPGSAIVLRDLGNAQMESGQLARAETTLRNAEAWGLLGQVLWMEGKSQEGKTAFAKAIALDPEVADLRSSFATFLLKDGDTAEAEKQIREALRLRPGSAPIQANLAGLLASRGENSEAHYHFEQSIRLNPASPDTRLNYARFLASLDDPSNALVQVELAIAADSKLAGAHELLGSLLGMKGDVDGTLRALQLAVQLQPDSGHAQYQLGVALGLKRDRAGAIEHLKLARPGRKSERARPAAKARPIIQAAPYY